MKIGLCNKEDFEILRKESEKKFHNDFFGKKRGRETQAKFYDKRITDFLLKYAYTQMGDLEEKKILYYGCGINQVPLITFVSKGAYVISIDLSSEAIKSMRKIVEEMDLSKQAEILEMDGENLSFPDSIFDLVFGTAIIHHLDVKKASSEISRVLKKGGKAIFIEPLGMNPIINFYRFLTPGARTKDEHPLKKNDITLMKKDFSNCKQQNFFFLSLFAFFWKYLKNDTLFGYSLKILTILDDLLFKMFHFLKSYCWCTVIVLEK